MMVTYTKNPFTTDLIILDVKYKVHASLFLSLWPTVVKGLNMPCPNLWSLPFRSVRRGWRAALVRRSRSLGYCSAAAGAVFCGVASTKRPCEEERDIIKCFENGCGHGDQQKKHQIIFASFVMFYDTE